MTRCTVQFTTLQYSVVACTTVQCSTVLDPTMVGFPLYRLASVAQLLIQVSVLYTQYTVLCTIHYIVLTPTMVGFPLYRLASMAQLPIQVLSGLAASYHSPYSLESVRCMRW